jgi:phosphoribosylanthranilate isomerase
VRAEDLVACAELGVDAIGLNLWSGSPRGVGLAAACELLRAAGVANERGEAPIIVAVLVDPSPAELAAVCTRLRPDAIQLHGARDIAAYPGVTVPHVRVLRGTPASVELDARASVPRWTLLDAAVPGYGGAGVRTDWIWARSVVQRLAPHPVWLAGGIGPDNAAQAIADVAPAGIDVASGAETRGAPPGHKSRERIAALVEICARGNLR